MVWIWWVLGGFFLIVAGIVGYIGCLEWQYRRKRRKYERERKQFDIDCKLDKFSREQLTSLVKRRRR